MFVDRGVGAIALRQEGHVCRPRRGCNRPPAGGPCFFITPLPSLNVLQTKINMTRDGARTELTRVLQTCPSSRRAGLGLYTETR